MRNRINFSNGDITERSKESPLWDDLSKQESRVLPYLLERYLLLENWKYLDSEEGVNEYAINYMHLLMANMTTVLLSYEERLRNLENE